tara:strand:+ start:376 stop:495 length:120 start_codon:yes stop_codon:yes gene_type:complete
MSEAMYELIYTIEFLVNIVFKTIILILITKYIRGNNAKV